MGLIVRHLARCYACGETCEVTTRSKMEPSVSLSTAHKKNCKHCGKGSLYSEEWLSVKRM